MTLFSSVENMIHSLTLTALALLKVINLVMRTLSVTLLLLSFAVSKYFPTFFHRPSMLRRVFICHVVVIVDNSFEKRQANLALKSSIGGDIPSTDTCIFCPNNYFGLAHMLFKINLRNLWHLIPFSF